MQAKALIIAVADYPKLNKNLLGPPNDLILWSSLLTLNYGVSCSKLVPPSATKEGIIQELTSFVAGAATGDNLVVVFSGHGTSTTPQCRAKQADGLVAYMTDDMTPQEVDRYVLYDFEIKEIIEPVKQSGALLTFVLDCCFATGVGDDLSPPEIGTYEPSPRSSARFVDLSQWRYADKGQKRWWRFCRRFCRPRFSDVIAGKQRISYGTTEPLILVATESESAYEGEINDKVYGLFSRHATVRLTANPSLSHDTLAECVHRDLQTINPVHFDQSPDVAGHSGRDSNPFLT